MRLITDFNHGLGRRGSSMCHVVNPGSREEEGSIRHVMTVIDGY